MKWRSCRSSCQRRLSNVEFTTSYTGTDTLASFRYTRCRNVCHGHCLRQWRHTQENRCIPFSCPHWSALTLPPSPTHRTHERQSRTKAVRIRLTQKVSNLISLPSTFTATVALVPGCGNSISPLWLNASVFNIRDRSQAVASLTGPVTYA